MIKIHQLNKLTLELVNQLDLKKFIDPKIPITLAIIQQILREKFEIDIFPVKEPLSNLYRGCTFINRKLNNYIESDAYYPIYEDSLEAGVQKALKYLIMKKSDNGGKYYE